MKLPFLKKKKTKTVPEFLADDCAAENSGECEEYEEYDPLKAVFGKLYVKILLVITAISLPILIISLLSPSFSEYYSRTVGHFFRMLIGKVTGIFPFSVSELILAAGILFFIYGIARGIYESVKKVNYKDRFEIPFQRTLVCCILAAFSLYNFSFAACSRRYPLEQNLGLSREGLTKEQLYDCMLLVSDELSECLEKGDIRRTPDGASCLPYSYDELNRRLNECYVKFSENYDFLETFDSNAKRVALSSLMTYTHISGIYIPYTGEVNINTNYPDYVIAFTYGHEMAHQRGIALEDEANFVAFIAMYEYGDNYLRYCALTELFSYLSDALYSADSELFYDAVYKHTDSRVIDEMIAFENFFVPYTDSAASAVMGTVNDISIKLRGDSDGIKSYNMMVELASSYFGIGDEKNEAE